MNYKQIAYAAILFAIGHVILWYQSNAQFFSEWAKEHKILMACDFKDDKGKSDMFCITNKNLLKKIWLYVEDPKYTKGWCHLQASAPPSGAIFFVPYNGSPKKEAYDKLFENIRY